MKMFPANLHMGPVRFYYKRKIYNDMKKVFLVTRIGSCSEAIKKEEKIFYTFFIKCIFYTNYLYAIVC